MTPNGLAAALPLLLGIQGLKAAAQQPERLILDRTVDRRLAAGESHSYILPLDSGRFAAGVALQRGIHLQVVVIGPAGDTLATFDSQNGANGPEPFHLQSRSRGDYRVILAALPEATGSGSYALTLRRSEPLATSPAGKVDQLMFGIGAHDPGAVVMVMQGGEITYQKAWGLANLTYDIPFTVDTRTNIGSTPKQFTAFAILLLAGEGKLSLDDDVRKYIPELPDLGAPVTLRNLLTHTSGYREFLNTLYMAGRRLDEGDYIDRSEVIGIVQRQPELQNQPGAEFNYNNTGFSLLATVVERVGGKPFPKWMEEDVFRPIGMMHTGIRAHPTDIVPGSAQGYAADSTGAFREVRDIGGSMGAGGIYTTVGDLALWIRNFHTAAVGAPHFLAQMTTRNVLTNGDTSSYGLGLFVDNWRGLTRFQHGGADAAHRSQLTYFPALDAAVVTESNDAAFNAARTADQIAGIFFADELAPAQQALPTAAVVAGAAVFDPEKFDAYVGRYELNEMPGFVITFTREGTRLLSQATGQRVVELTATSDSTLAVKGIAASLTFHRNDDGAVASLTLHQNGEHPARRLDMGTPPAQPDLAEYAGRYYSEELDFAYDLKAEGDRLIAIARHMLPVPLSHSRGETFAGVLPLATVQFVRDAQGKVTGFTAGNGRTRDVRFMRQ